MTKYTDDLLAAWLQDSPAAGPADALERALGVTRHTSQRPGWLVALTGGTIGTHEASGGTGRAGDRRAVTVLVAVVLVGLLAGAIALGSGVVQLPNLLPSPSPDAEESPDATPGISAEPTPSPSPEAPLGLVVYNVTELIQPLPDNCTPPNHPWCHVQRIWVANSDGTGAHELLPGVPGDQQAFGWTPDGSRILYRDSSCQLRFADAEGSVLETLPLDILYPTRTSENPCDYVDLSAGFSFSPDGTRLAYVLGEGDPGSATTTTIAIYDLDTREGTRLESTSATDTGTCVTASEGLNQSPMWSPDGTRLVVTRDNIGPIDENHACRSIIYTVNADGTAFHVVVPSEAGSQPLGASWSPDGSLIVFHRGNYANGGAGDTCDIATIRPDGSDLRQLTSDGISCGGGWTRDGRILYRKWLDPDGSATDLWIMDADGGNARRLEDTSIEALTAPTCVDCPFVDPNQTVDGLRQPLP